MSMASAATVAALLLLPLTAAPGAAQQRDTIPYRGALAPADPQHLPPPPLGTGVQAALNVLYERPSPQGPPAIPAAPRAIYARGKAPVVQVLPGPLVNAEHVPEMVREAAPPKGPFSNNVVRLKGGKVEFVAFDRTVNDTKLSADSFAVRASFTDHAGARWRLVSTRIAPLSPDPVNDPWYGGVVIDTTLHGETGRNTPLEPQVNCAMCAWTWADIYKNDKRVGSSILLHVMLTSDVRDDANGFRYACYDCSANPVREIHLIMPPQDYLPSPGGFLHLMWENADFRRGTPEQIAASAPKLWEGYPDLVINAVPYLNWSEKEVHVRAGQRYRLILNNEDPTVWHAFHLHGMEGEGHSHGGGNSATDIPQGPIPLPQASQWVTTVMFAEPGRYEYGCPVMNHEMRGMKGYIVVDPAGPTASTDATINHGEGR